MATVASSSMSDEAGVPVIVSLSVPEIYGETPSTNSCLGGQ